MFFQYYSLVIFIICAVVMIVVSYMTEAPSYEKIAGLTFGTITDENRKETRDSWSAIDVIGSVTVVLLIIAAYIYFAG